VDVSAGWLLPLVPTLAANESRVAIDPGIIALFIPILAIVFGSIAGIMKMVFMHRERMAKIGMGIDPDAQARASD
jgi:hypothetical protein